MPIKEAGLKFGKLTILDHPYTYRKPGPSSPKYVTVQCDCGSPAREMRLTAMTSAGVTSCGCIGGKQVMHKVTLGQVIGALTVVSGEFTVGRHRCVTVKDSNGETKTMRVARLTTDVPRATIARKHEFPAGKRFGLLTCLGTESTKKGGIRYIDVQCDCGSPPTSAQASHLVNGGVRSCGCLSKVGGFYHTLPVLEHLQYNKDGTKKQTADGNVSVSPEYKILSGIFTRCYSPSNTRYLSYGGRGIKICDEWRNPVTGKMIFETFLADMGKRPTADHSIDRIDGNEGYHPLNCRWATTSQQNYNRLGMFGQYHTISPGVFTTTMDIHTHNIRVYGMVASDAYKGYSINFARNFFQYCKDTIPNFDDAACIAYLKEHKGIYLIEDLKVEGAALPQVDDTASTNAE